MYCNKCGKQHSSNDILCDECRAKQNQPVPKADNRAGIGALFLSVFAVICSVLVYVNASRSDDDGMLIFAIGSCLFILVALLTAVGGIKAYKRAVVEGKLKPVASFVTSIIALTMLAVSFVMMVLAVCCA